MREAVEANRHPLNRRARELLEKAGADPDPGFLYVIQLMQIALAKRQSGLGNRARDEALEPMFARMLARDPSEVMRELELEGEEVQVRPEQLRGLSPIQAAQVLLQAVHRVVLANDLAYQ